MNIDLNDFEKISRVEREKILQQALNERIGPNFDKQTQDQQLDLWKNALYSVWKPHAQNSVFSRAFIETYCENDFTLQYLIQSLNKANDITGIVQLCNAAEQLHSSNFHWHANPFRFIPNFAIEFEQDFDPIVRLQQLKAAGLSQTNIQYYCYVAAVRNPQNWDVCVKIAQQDEQDFAFNAMRFMTKDFSFWGLKHMFEECPKVLSMEQWETHAKALVQSNQVLYQSWLLQSFFGDDGFQPLTLDEAQIISCFLNLVPGPCLEANLPHWKNLFDRSSQFRATNQCIEQRIEESMCAHQHQHIISSLDTNGARSTARKI